MGLKLGQLRQAAQKVIDEEKSVGIFGRELTRVLGPTVVTTYGLKIMAESANNKLDILQQQERTPGQIATSLLLKFVDSDLREVRKLVARLLPESFLHKLMNDKDYGVRSAVAVRLPSYLIKEMVQKNPSDDQLTSIYRQKKLEEKKQLMKNNGHGHVFDAAHGVHSKGNTEQELTDPWYTTLAFKIVTQYGNNIEGQWEESAVKSFCDTMKLQDIEVDQQKLLDCVYEYLANRDEAALEESVNLDVAFMPILPDVVDPVKQLIESRVSPAEYMKKFEELFCVKCGIHESFKRVSAPASALLPDSMLRSTEEKALDLYVRNWNNSQSLKGSPYILSWSPSAIYNRVNFTLGVR